MSLSSAVRTVLVEHQMPYRVQRTLDRAMTAIGVHEKVVSVNDMRFRVRRGTCDEDFVRLVVQEREYLPDGITIGPTDTIVDIGGNIGTFAVLAATLAPRGLVISVEPDPDNLRLLRHNVALNHARVIVVDAAASATGAPLTLHVSAHGGGYHSTIAGRHADTHPITVPGISLSQLCARHDIARIDLLKLDCEGAEFDILYRLPSDTLRRIRQIAMEYHADQQTREAQTRELLAFATAHGFRVIRHDPFPHHPGGHLFLAHP